MNTRNMMFDRIINDYQILAKVTMNQLKLCKEMINGEGDRAELEANEIIIDSLEMKLRSEMVQVIARFNPLASDIRRLIAYFDMVSYIERIGDHIINVSRSLGRLNGDGEACRIIIPNLKKLYEIVESMTQNAIFAFASNDNYLAKQIIEQDNQADALNHEIMNTLRSWGSCNEVSDLIELGALAYNLERIGDNATNIAECAIFVVEGTDIKHNEQ